MTWLLVVIVVAIIGFLILRNRPKEEQAQPTPAQSVPQLAEPSAAPVYAVQESEDDELFAVIAAAVAEFEGGGEFQVLSIRPSGRNWTFTGRQELMQGRL
jgi:Na+-transporting methylmalonyl-CoA/oxaloacetate decarboxylase gamma subunit